MEISEWKVGWQLWDLVSHLKENGGFGSNNIFRGQSDASWGLVPGLYRRDVNLTNASKTKAELYLFAEEQMIDAFFARAAMLLPGFQRGPLVDRFVAQHYGVPTQLLDWTIDPFIALYFAVHGGNPEKDCALFYLRPLRTLGYGDIPATNFPWKGRIASVRPPVVHDRVQAQKSAFTLQSFGEAEEFTSLDQRKLKYSQKGEGTHKNDEVSIIGKVIIPAKRREQILFQLLQLGVDSSLVYPGLQGIGQRIADLAHIQKYGGRNYY